MRIMRTSSPVTMSGTGTIRLPLFALLIIVLCARRTFSRRSFSLNLPDLNFDLEPPLPADEDDDFEPMEFRHFPSFRSKPPVHLPLGSELQPNGSVIFPNGSVLMTVYDVSSVLEDNLGMLRLTNGTSIPAATTPHLLPKGLVLNVSDSPPEDFPSLVLPRGSLVFRNGTLLVPRRYRIPTVFVEGFIPYCEGVKCHLKPPQYD